MLEKVVVAVEEELARRPVALEGCLEEGKLG